jgi:hypothetical protein
MKSKPLDRKRLLTLGGAAAALILTVLFLHRMTMTGAVSHLRSDTFPESFRIAVIADLDQSSKKEKSWYSLYMTVRLRTRARCVAPLSQAYPYPPTSPTIPSTPAPSPPAGHAAPQGRGVRH